MAEKPLTVDEPTKACLIAAAKETAIALVRFWELLHAVEKQLNGEFDGTVRLIEEMAVAVNPRQIADTTVWTGIQHCWAQGNKP